MRTKAKHSKTRRTQSKANEKQRKQQQKQGGRKTMQTTKQSQAKQRKTNQSKIVVIRSSSLLHHSMCFPLPWWLCKAKQSNNQTPNAMQSKSKQNSCKTRTKQRNGPTITCDTAGRTANRSTNMFSSSLARRSKAKQRSKQIAVVTLTRCPLLSRSRGRSNEVSPPFALPGSHKRGVPLLCVAGSHKWGVASYRVKGSHTRGFQALV